MTLTRGFIRNAATTPLDARLMSMATIVCNADGSPRVGVLGGANPSIVSTTATMHLAVAAAEFATSKGKADGVAIFTNDGVVNVPVTAAPASNSRIDVLWVKHEDNTTGDAASLPIFGVTAGVSAASPTKPAIPTGALELATLRIFSGTTATNGGANILTNTYQMTAARGGVVPFRTVTERDAWTTRVDGQLAYCADVDAHFVYSADAVGGGAWIHHGGKVLISSFTPTGIYTSAGARLVEAGGMMRLEGTVTSSSALYVAGTSYAIGSIPADKAPILALRFVCTSNATAVAEVTVATTGAITIKLNVGFTGNLDLSLAGCAWPDKRLG